MSKACARSSDACSLPKGISLPLMYGCHPKRTFSSLRAKFGLAAMPIVPSNGPCTRKPKTSSVGHCGLVREVLLARLAHAIKPTLLDLREHF
jgi:hypothetical protein